ncbi:MAG: YraN family protein [Candidatus Peregrinibacteria bacterium]|nr:YraN family protein [Candidatus Peregrinibacteria bacterium]
MTTQTTKDIGDKGENLACRLLEERGYLIIDRNVRGRYGEVDIVAKKDNIYHFVEVRLRTNVTFGTPVETVNAKKRLRLKKTIEYYCMTKGVMRWQIDIIAIQYLKFASKIIFYKNIPLE